MTPDLKPVPLKPKSRREYDAKAHAEAVERRFNYSMKPTPDHTPLRAGPDRVLFDQLAHLRRALAKAENRILELEQELFFATHQETPHD